MTTCARGWEQKIGVTGSLLHRFPDAANSWGLCLATGCERRKAKEERRVRCGICLWPLVESVKDGCIDGNCSLRFETKNWEYDAVVQRREANKRKYPGRRKASAIHTRNCQSHAGEPCSCRSRETDELERLRAQYMRLCMLLGEGIAITSAWPGIDEQREWCLKAIDFLKEPRP